MSTTEADRNILNFFPFPTLREKQGKALSFIQRAVDKGFKDIVVAAPTGSGKTPLGVAACLWANDDMQSPEQSGGYYLVTQKLLQDQLTGDFDKFVPRFREAASSLKTASEYVCPTKGNCAAGGKSKPMCHQRKANMCPYKAAYDAFALSPVALTNYAYFMTERAHVGKLQPRKILIADECHSVEKQLLGFVDVTIGNKEMAEWAPHIGAVPFLPDGASFCTWLEDVYIKVIKDRLELKQAQAEDSKEAKIHQELQQLQSHHGRLHTVVNGLREDGRNWVYWQEEDREDGGGRRSTAKPIEAAKFAGPLLMSHAGIRVFMSAYPGEKKVFCRSLGLDDAKVAWCSLGSTFPVENRPVHLYYAGSMSRSAQDATLPKVLRMVKRCMDMHAEEKGVLHSHTYAIGQKVYNYLVDNGYGNRVLFPTKASERVEMLGRHMREDKPTVIISPSMTEGYSFDDDAARWQCVLKCAHPFLGDKQIKAKQERDPEWYAMQAAMAFIQSVGRIVRSEKDRGVTYCFDSDLGKLMDRYPQFFPAWFTSALMEH